MVCGPSRTTFTRSTRASIRGRYDHFAQSPEGEMLQNFWYHVSPPSEINVSGSAVSNRDPPICDFFQSLEGFPKNRVLPCYSVTSDASIVAGASRPDHPDWKRLGFWRTRSCVWNNACRTVFSEGDITRNVELPQAACRVLNAKLPRRRPLSPPRSVVSRR